MNPTFLARKRLTYAAQKSLLRTSTSLNQATRTTKIRTVSSVATARFQDERLLVVGSGVAGSAAALIAAETYRIPVTMLYAGGLPTDCNSYWAQGGIIYRNYDPASRDSAQLLAGDIHRAGAGLCDNEAVMKVATEGPVRVQQLLLDDENEALRRFASVPFERNSETGELKLCLEASHSAARILYKADHTGRVITEHITAAARKHPLITHLPNTLVTDLIVRDNTCVGIHTLNHKTNQQDFLIGTRGTVLCTGGLAGIYQHSTNPPGFNALGSSTALAARAGARLRDLEYVQFHPTSLFIPNEARFLLTEALRGEGAVLRDADGRAFAKDYHPDGELAPRDIVARAVFEESQKRTDVHNAYLDISHRDATWLYQRFPSIQQHLTKRGLDIASQPLPVIPAAHYTCGGIETDSHGRTSVNNLFAAGEAARTGLHGGNRLASTSLLEGLVYGASVADYVGSSETARDISLHASSVTENIPTVKPTSFDTVTTERASKQASMLLSEVKKIMWDQVGLVRTPLGLETAIDDLEDLRNEATLLHEKTSTKETVAVRDATYSGLAVAKAAAANRISAGTHYIVDEGDESDSNDSYMAASGAP